MLFGVQKLDMHPIALGAMLVTFLGPLLLVFYTSQPILLAMAVYLNLSALSFYDYREYRLPNILNASFFVIATYIAFTDGTYLFQHHIVGAIIGLSIPLVISLIYKKIRDRDGLGMGDVKLLAGAGMLLGWPELPIILSISSTLGIVYAIARFGVKNEKMSLTHIPFGPFIAFSTLILWLIN